MDKKLKSLNVLFSRDSFDRHHFSLLTSLNSVLGVETRHNFKKIDKNKINQKKL